MMLPNLYLSRPATIIPDTALDNETVLSRVRESFRGPASEWDLIEQSIRYVFDRCNTKMRYLDEDPALSPGEFASRAAAACLQENGVAATDIDLLVYGGIARDAFEPATAAEVSGRLGAKPLHAMDVTCACAGLIEALHVVAGYFAIHDGLRTALICAGELTRDWINYDMQSLEDVEARRRRPDARERRRRVSDHPGAAAAGWRAACGHSAQDAQRALCPLQGARRRALQVAVDRAVRARGPRSARGPPPPRGRRLVAGGRRPLCLPPAERGACGASLDRARRAAPGVRAHPLAVREHGEHLVGRRARLPPEERHRPAPATRSSSGAQRPASP